MRWKAELPYLLPALLLNPLLYWHGYYCWFQQDDFAWLGLLQMLHSADDLPRLLFEPMAQGTIRPISERGFFLLFRWLFDLDAAPYHALAAIAQTANLTLLYALARRLSGSPAAAGLAAVLWCSNSVLAWPLSWASALNQILISCCFLAGVSAFIRFADTGGRRWLALAWLIFLTGFGVLESNVVFPAVMLLYALLYARHTLRQATWMISPAIAFALIHTMVVSKAQSGAYGLEVGLELPRTLARYWAMAVWPAETRQFTGLPTALVAVPALAVALLIAWRLWRRDRLAAFGMGWFLATLSIYLVLPHHVSDYYLTVPTIGLALAFAAALMASPRPLAAAMLLLILPISWFCIRRFTARARARSTAWESIMDGVGQIARAHPGQSIYLEGIGTDLFVHGFTDSPFRLIGVPGVVLTPHEAQEIDYRGWLPSMDPFTVPAEVALRALDSGEAHSFRFEGDRFRNTTASYKKRLAASGLAASAPARLALGDAAYGYLLGSGWFSPQDGYRWMGKSAVAALGLPAGPFENQRVHVHGFCAPAQLASGPLHLSVETETVVEPARFTIDSCAGSFDFAAPLPPSLRGRPRFTVTLSVDRAAVVPPDTRELGLAIETLEVR